MSRLVSALGAPPDAPRSAGRSPGPPGSPAVSSPGLLTPDGSEPKAANNKKALFGLSMKWRSDKKVRKVLMGLLILNTVSLIGSGLPEFIIS